MAMVFRLMRKFLWDDDNMSWEIGYKGCWVHVCVSFLTIIGRFRSLISTELREISREDGSFIS